MTQKSVVLSGLWVIPFLIAFSSGCGNNGDDEGFLGAVGESPTGQHIPSVDELISFCESLEGASEVLFAADSDEEDSFCRFGGALVGSLTLFRALEQDQKVQALIAYQNSSPASPSAEDPEIKSQAAIGFCEEAGGRVREFLNETGPVGVCIFPDNSRIEVLTLYNGAGSPESAPLNQVLEKGAPPIQPFVRSDLSESGIGLASNGFMRPFASSLSGFLIA